MLWRQGRSAERRHERAHHGRRAAGRRTCVCARARRARSSARRVGRRQTCASAPHGVGLRDGPHVVSHAAAPAAAAASAAQRGGAVGHGAAPTACQSYQTCARLARTTGGRRRRRASAGRPAERAAALDGARTPRCEGPRWLPAARLVSAPSIAAALVPSARSGTGGTPGWTHPRPLTPTPRKISDRGCTHPARVASAPVRDRVAAREQRGGGPTGRRTHPVCALHFKSTGCRRGRRLNLRRG